VSWQTWHLRDDPPRENPRKTPFAAGTRLGDHAGVLTVIAVTVVGGFTWYVLSPEERGRVLRRVAAPYNRVHKVATRKSAPDPFVVALRERTPTPLVMPGLVLLNLTLLVSMMSSSGAMAGADTLLNWGASTGPRTTNGEWSRLVTSLFVHAGPWLFVVNTLALVQAGLIVERLAGHVAFATIYLSSGVFASLAAISSSPITINSGASGAVAGVYGLLVAATMWGLVRKSPLTPPLRTIIGLAPCAIVFMLVNGVSGALPIEAEMTGFVTGILGGLVMTCGVADRKPPLKRVALAASAALTLAIAAAVPLRGITDATDELARIVEIETRISDTYQRAVGQFRLGTMSAGQLARMIERSIMPEIQAARRRLLSLDRVPAEQQALVASAEEYLRLRDESWRLRFEALSQSSMGQLRTAEHKERASLEALERIRPAVEQPQ
jgi:membrane associated rhomboid family serine protease